MAIVSKRSSAAARRGCGPGIAAMPRATSRTSRRHHRTGSTRSRRSSTARSSRSTRPAGRRSRCSRLGPASSSAVTSRVPIVYQVFDLLFLDGESMLDVPLDERKVRLRAVLRDHPLVRYAGHIEADGESLFASVQAEGLEGIMAKRRSSRYEPGRRSHAWLKIKNRPEQEFVVAGWEPGSVAHRDLGSLVLGVYDDEGRLRFAGEVGSGLDARTRRDLIARMAAISRDTSPFDAPPRLPRVHWVEPELVVRVEFAEWTRDELVRQSAYRGIEPEKDPRSVRRERPTARRADDRPTTQAPNDSTTKTPDRPTTSTRPAAKEATPAMPRSKPAADGPAQSAHPGRARGARRDGRRRHVVGRRPRGRADQPRQGHLPRRRADQARPDPLRRDHGAGHPALPARPRADPDALPERDRRPALLGEGGAQARTSLAGALALREPQPGGLAHLRRRGPCRRARLPGQPGGHRAAPLDLAHRGRPPTDLCAHRHRSRAQDDLAGGARPGSPLSHRARAPRACAAIPR